MHILAVEPDSNRKLIAEMLRQVFKSAFQLVHKLVENRFYCFVFPTMRDHDLVGYGKIRLDEIVFLKRLVLPCRLGDSLFYFVCLNKLSGG